MLARRHVPLLVAAEFQSEVRRFEAVLRRSAEKAGALAASALARQTERRFGQAPEIGRLLVLRSTAANRAVASEFAATLRAAHPAGPAAVRAALLHGASWSGDGILWMSLHRRSVSILADWPRGVVQP